MIKRSILGLSSIIISTINLRNAGFSTVTQKLSDLKHVQKLHRLSLTTKQQFQSYFTNQYLLKLVEEGYCFSDLVNITNNLINYQAEKSDIQIMFMVYCYNLYYNQFKQGKVIIEDLIRLLKERIENNEYYFSNQNFEDTFFLNIKNLANRDNKYLEQEIRELKEQFFHFICMKNGLMKNHNQFEKINDQSLHRLYEICRYFPRQMTGKTFINKLERFYFDLVEYQCNNFHSISDDKINKQDMKESKHRFIILMEIGIITGKLSGKYLSIFQYLPRKFSSEQKFINFMKIMKQIFTYQFMKRIDYKQFDLFNEQLSKNGQKYKSQAAIKAFEQYTQILIVHQYNNLKVFDHFYQELSVEQEQKQKL